jgi:hypothetical protein
MRRFLHPVLMAAVAVTPLCIGRTCLANSDPEHGPGAAAQSTTANASVSAPDVAPSAGVDASFLPPLPLAPTGKTTVIGGVIRNIDPVLDQMTLGVYGSSKTIKILFDERTKFYLNGVKTPLDGMHTNDHASVETTLDGDSVFAVSVHMLSQGPQGECRGQVLAFDPRDGVVTVRNTLSGAPIQLHVQPRTTIARSGQPTFTAAQTGTSDLMRGALIDVQFESDNRGNAIADAISILATPGSGFYFSGSITFLDLHAGTMAITDPRTQTSYTVSFDPAQFPASRTLHDGSRVGVTARFDGKQYVASKLDVY